MPAEPRSFGAPLRNELRVTAGWSSAFFVGLESGAIPTEFPVTYWANLWSAQIDTGDLVARLTLPLAYYAIASTPSHAGADWTELGYPRGMKAEVRDLWAHKSLGRVAGSFSATVAPHGVVMVRLLP